MKKRTGKLASMFASSLILPNRFRSKVLNLWGLQIGKSEIRAKCYFDSSNITIGDNSFVNYNCQFHTGVQGSKIMIGENVFLGMNVTMICVSHEIGGPEQRAGKNQYADITIENGVWCGANVTILPGVTIGSGSIIAAGSVITKDVEPNSLYAGNPAVLKRKLND
jgi:acetyltransferase-like isoleucine patch superfamily enzyme